MIAERVAVGAELIRDAIRREGVAGTEGIGDRVRIEFVGREVAEIFSLDWISWWAFSLVRGWAGRQVRFAGVSQDSHTEPLLRTPPLATVKILNLLAGCGI